MRDRGRMAKGTDFARSVFTDEQVRDIKREFLQGVYPTALAKRLGVTVGALAAIKNGKTWKHIQI